MKRLASIVFGLSLTLFAAAQYPVQSEGETAKQRKQTQLTAKEVERSMSNLPMISETRSMLLEATGWALQDDGEWVSSENRIPYKQVNLNESRKAFYKLGKENFTALEIRDVIVNNDLYVVFIIKFKTGWYEFPILMDGWHSQNALTYFVFKASKLQEVLPDKYENNTPYIVNTEALVDGTMVDYDKNTINSTIAYSIQKTINNKTIASHNLLIAFMPVEAGGIRLARFRMIQSMNRKKFYTPYLQKDNRDKLFRGSYYEVPFDQFQAFIRYQGGTPVQSFAGIPVTPEDFFKRGVSNYGIGNYAQSIADLTEAAKNQPYSDFFLTYAYRANSREKMGDNFGAMQDYDRAISLKPSDPNYTSAWLTTLYNRGVAKYNSKNAQGACQDWQTAVAMGFRDAATDDAIKENCKNFRFTPAQLTISTAPSSVPTTSTGSGPEMQTDYYKVYWDGVWRYQNGNYSEALRYFNRALELQPQTNVMTVYSYRGNCKLKMSDYASALADFDYAIAYSNSQPTDNNLMKNLWYNRGLANFFLGNKVISCSDFQKSIDSGMNDAESLSFIRQVCR
jgi:tetratricopeptide (TPR) repeat protein